MRGGLVSILCLLLLLLSGRSTAQQIYLLSVGVADYPGTEMDLRLPADDARAMYQLYRRNAAASAVLLTNQKATAEGIASAAEDLFSQATADDIVVLFFSGHGYSGGFAAQDTLLSYTRIRQFFQGCPARNKMIFADACYAGNIRQGGSEGHRIAQDGNIMLFLSCRSNEVSYEDPSMSNGYFTTCLTRCLKGGADEDRNRVITARELFVAVSRGVKTLSDDRQHPVMWGNFKDTMPVMVWK
jgi:uncharacterized caspase-like protein